MTEPTTEELVERLKFLAAFGAPEGLPLVFLEQVSQRLSDLEGKLGEARKVMRGSYAVMARAFGPLHSSGRALQSEIADQLGKSRAEIEAFLKLTASGGGDNSLSSAAEHSGSSTPRTSAPSSTGKED